MSRQLRTLITGGVLCIVLAVLSGSLRVPYVILTPGPTVNTLGKDAGTEVITISGHATSPTTGNLNLTTVSAGTETTTLIHALRGWLSRTQVVVPYDSVYPPGRTRQQQNESDKQDFVNSQNSAIAAAACELKYPVGIAVESVEKDSPNNGVLKPHDQFVSLGDKPTPDDATLRAVLATFKPGDKVPAEVIRDEARTPLTLTLTEPSKGSTSPRIGVTLVAGCLMPFDVKVDLTGIGGPSAGMMFALGILDKLGIEDLTHGKFVAGTGTIDGEGTVGRIGGIQLKMLGAKRDGATVFLAPAGNCDDVRGNVPSGLDVIKVSTLHEAVTSLEAVSRGETVAHC